MTDTDHHRAVLVGRVVETAWELLVRLGKGIEADAAERLRVALRALEQTGVGDEE